MLLAGAALGAPRAAGAQSAAAKPIDPGTRAELYAAREAVWRAWFANDSTALARLLPEAVAAGSGRSWQDRRSILEESRQFAAAGGRLVSLSFGETEIDLWGDVAVMRASYRLETENEGQRRSSGGQAVEVFVRRDGAWVNPLWHLSGDGS
jgi:hypothetical protein